MSDERLALLRVRREDIDHALALAPEMAWLLDEALVRFALLSPRLDPRAADILRQRRDRMRLW